MKTHRILYEHLGEYSYTEKQLVAVYEDGMVDLNARTTHTILSSDDWRPCPVQRYEVREIELPDWLTPQEWLRGCDYVRWHFIWAWPEVKEWPESWQRFLFTLDEYRRKAAIKLLATQDFRSDLRRSLREQLEDWLDTAPEHRTYQSPFSTRQWQALLKFVR